MVTPLQEALIARYQPHESGYDEMCTPDGEVRPHWQYLTRALTALGPGALEQRRGEARRLLRENGVTYNVYNDPAGGQRTWALDPIPLLISSEEWRRIESGLTQRAEVLNLLLRDLYGPRELLRRGLLPPELIYGHPGFLRPCYPLRNAKPHVLIFYAADLARGPDGRMWVLSDRSQAPSGAGYALENRTVMSRIFPSLYRDSHVHRLALFFQNLRASLAAYAPRVSGDEPRVVILTPGPLNETYFEHAYLANYLGYSLVRGDDLTVRDGRVWLRSLKRLEPVDVILRRIDDHYCDPLELFPDSRLGIPGLVEATRRGNVAVANPLGISVLENPALHAFLPGIAQHFLGQELELPSVATWWCGQTLERRHVIANLDRMVIRMTHRRTGARPIYGSLLSREERRELARRIRAEPHLYVGQEQVSFSCAPSLVDGQVAARHAVLRSFLVARDDGYVVMPGGLTRVASSGDSFIVSNQAGGIAKDTWVIASEPEKQASLLHAAAVEVTLPALRLSLPPRTAENLFWFARYAERAEHGVRLMRTVLAAYYNTAEYEEPYNHEMLEALLQALTHATATYPGFVGPHAATTLHDPVAELASLIAVPQRSGGIAFNLRAMLQAANGMRHLLSGDTLRLINVTQDQLAKLENIAPERLADAQAPLNDLVTALAALSGMVMESMLRGEAWLFLDIGRRLERALSLVALLRGTLTGLQPAPVETALLAAVLRSCESLMAYRRGYSSSPEIIPTLALLLLNENNPRALAFQLAGLERHVAALPRDNHVSQLSEEARHVLEAATAVRLGDLGKLAAVDPGSGLRGDLDQLLVRVDHLLRQTADALGRDYFADVRGPQQLIGTEPSP
jgi:uncharacterized circularly permuted ATP-grasp superfamily protein/uncharacterized alpha-E superfamily protein